MESRAAAFSEEADVDILGIGVYIRCHHVSAAVDENFKRADVEQHLQLDGFRGVNVQFADIHVVLTARERNAGLTAVDGKYAFFLVKIYYCFMRLSREEFDACAGSGAGLQSQAVTVPLMPLTDTSLPVTERDWHVTLFLQNLSSSLAGFWISHSPSMPSSLGKE